MTKALRPPEFVRMDSDFSIFKYLEENGFDTLSQLHRCFSIARAGNAYGFLVEELDTRGDGIVQEEYDWLKTKYPKYECSRFVRISFWKHEKLFGIFRKSVPYGIVLFRCEDPCDGVHGPVKYVYEAVFPKYDHRHNCVHSESEHEYLIDGVRRVFKGVLFAQQNGLSKCCAHVALYSLLEGRSDVSAEVSFTMMNTVAFGSCNYAVDLDKRGLYPNEIEKILTHYGVNFKSIQYEESEESFQRDHDYVSYVYAGSESGQGALLGFDLDNEKKRFFGVEGGSLGHIIPVYGHTFNKDTWVPDASRKYFAPNKALGYMPSSQWMSSFIAHDDNVGANLCIPRWFIKHASVKYVIELLPRGVKNNAVEIEGQALQILYSIVGTKTIVGKLKREIWFRRLCDAVNSADVILRTQPIDISKYVMHLKRHADFSEAEYNLFPNEGVYWLVEVSVPQLFPANEMKIADLIFNAAKEIDVDAMTNFGVARVPGGWLFPVNAKEFRCVTSNVVSPLENYV